MILITGASGNVGKEVLKHVSETRSEVRAAYESLKQAAAPAGVETVMVYFNQPETLRAALQGVGIVCFWWDHPPRNFPRSSARLSTSSSSRAFASFARQAEI